MNQQSVTMSESLEILYFFNQKYLDAYFLTAR